MSMNEFKTDVQGTKGFYTIEYRTNSRANYEEAQELLRKFVDNKPKTNFDKVTESVESLAEFLAINERCINCPVQICVLSFAEKGKQECIEQIIEWLRKECEE